MSFALLFEIDERTVNVSSCERLGVSKQNVIFVFEFRLQSELKRNTKTLLSSP